MYVNYSVMKDEESSKYLYKENKKYIYTNSIEEYLPELYYKYFLKKLFDKIIYHFGNKFIDDLCIIIKSNEKDNDVISFSHKKLDFIIEYKIPNYNEEEYKFYNTSFYSYIAISAIIDTIQLAHKIELTYEKNSNKQIKLIQRR